MTTYVIDATNPAPPRQGDAGLFLRNGDSLVLLESGEILGMGYGDAVYGDGNNLITVAGRLHSNNWGGIVTQGRVTITATGEVSTGSSWGYFGIVLNEGGPNYLNNAGSVLGGVLFYSGHNELINSGLISKGITCGISASGSPSFSLQNTGTITGDDRYAVWGETDAPNTIINSGSIVGNISLGQDNDFYDGRGGHLQGEIALGAGEDIAFGGDGADSFFLGMFIEGVESGSGQGTDFIDGGSGSDTLRFYDSVTVDLRMKGSQLLKQGTWATLRGIENLAGGRFNDDFSGNDTQNVLSGNAGNDKLAGYGDDDRLVGGIGNDVLSGGDGTDIAVFAASFSSYDIVRQADGSCTVTDRRRDSADNEGTDTLTGIEYLQFADRTIAVATNSAPTSVSLSSTLVDGDAPVGTLIAILSGVDPDGDALGYSLVSNPGNHFRIHGNKLLVDRAFTDRDADISITVRASDPHGASIDRTFVIEVDPDVISIPPGEVPEVIDDPAIAPATITSLTLTGGRKADVLVGGDGDDLLNGGLGIDKLTGGGGADVFAFSTKLGKTNVDIVTDFREGDVIQLSKAVFGKIGTGALKDGALRFGKTALDKDDRILIDRKSGDAFYDADGSGTKYAAVKFATFKKAHLDAGDFLIV
ncbi:hypothetical protein AB4097_10165 [Microvirga sp. 2MCAF35]|uniref:hypothetical protein n=1 Tax=Microvirga sp. 2MCAF35 TaxID=3232987 RepID=UPI003F958318